MAQDPTAGGTDVPAPELISLARAMRELEASEPGPIFVGGTGRSGTTIVSRLIGHHDRFELIPYEVRFHAEPDGLPGLLGMHCETTMEKFLARMRGAWSNSTPQGRLGGFSRMFDRPRFDNALEEFETSFNRDRLRACRSLVHELLDPIAVQAGKPEWVEMTPRNAMHADALFAMFPNMRLIHSVRDGRDTAASLVAKGWAPDMMTALRWWGERMRTARRSTRRIPKSRLLVLRLEHLVSERREETYRRLLTFLQVEDQPEMREFFEREMTPDRANLGRWREQLADKEVDDFIALHREIQGGHREDQRSRRARRERARSGGRREPA